MRGGNRHMRECKGVYTELNAELEQLLILVRFFHSQFLTFNSDQLLNHLIRIVIDKNSMNVLTENAFSDVQFAFE